MQLISKKGLRVSTATLCVLAFIAAGCTGQANNGPNGGPSSSADNGGTGTATKPVVITTARWVDATTKFKSGEDIDNNVHTRWMKEQFGIEMKHIITAPNEGDLMTKMRLALAGNQEWPDVFFVRDMQFATEAIEAGKVMPIDEALEKFGSDKLKKLYDAYPQAFAPVVKDGQRYGLPTFMEGSASGGSVMYIREDWLRNLSLQAPTTIEELAVVMDKFVNEDPDKNGVKDTYGLATNLENGFTAGFAAQDGIIGALSDYLPGTWGKNAEGKLVYGSVQDSMKSVLSTFRDWVEKGYINPEAGMGRSWEDFVEGKAGILFGPMWLPIWPLPDMTVNNPQAEYKPYPLPAGSDGKKGFKADPMPDGIIMFKKDFSHMDLVMNYLDVIYDYWIGDESSTLKYGFHEGYDYIEHDGNVYYNDLEANGVPKEKWPQDNGQLLEIPKYISFFGGNSSIPRGSFERSALKFKADPKAEVSVPIDVEVKFRWPELAQDAYLIYMEDKESQIPNWFTGAPTTSMLSKQDLLNKMETDAFIKIIYGKESLSYFDTFVENWNKSGGVQITDEVNKWYEAVQ